MKIITEDDLQVAASCLQQGGLVAFPTETVYGLGANALNPVAVAKIFQAKERPTFDPLIVHIADRSQLDDLFLKPVNPIVYQLVEKFWPGPLTIVQPKSAIVPDLVTSGLSEVAVRMPSHPVALKLLRLAAVPVAAPSANKFGQLSPTTSQHVAKQNMPVDYIVAETSQHVNVGIESTVVSLDGSVCTILRPGVITQDDLQRAVPGLDVQLPGLNVKLTSPGLLKSHYSPRKPLFFLKENQITLPENSGLILHDKSDKVYNAKVVKYTSENNDMLEIAAGLFAVLHALEDDDSVTQIYIQTVEETGIGVAIMDRLKKATYKYDEFSSDRI